MGTRAPDTVKRLVEQFDRHFDSLHTPAYNETQLRVDYLDPFFESLGWDTDSEGDLSWAAALRAGHTAQVEGGREIRTAGDVHHSPSHIAGRIVKKTIGKLIASSPSAEIQRDAGMLDTRTGRNP